MPTNEERREVAEELWSPVSGFDKYEVSKNGEIRNTKTGKLLSQYKNRRGYKKVCLYLDGKKKYLFAHRIVAMAFIKNDYPDTCTQVNHINENKGDNRVENLEWVTPSENINHGTCIERRAKSQSRTVEMTYRGIRVLFDSTRDASERTGIPRKAIQDVCRGKCKTTSGASFRYVNKRDSFIDPEPERTCHNVSEGGQGFTCSERGTRSKWIKELQL